MGKDDRDPVGVIERALAVTITAEPIIARIRAAVKEGKLDGTLAPESHPGALAQRALRAGVIDAAEANVLATTTSSWRR